MGHLSSLRTKLDSTARQSTGNKDKRAGQGLDPASVLESVKILVRVVLGENVILEVDKEFNFMRSCTRHPK